VAFERRLEELASSNGTGKPTSGAELLALRGQRP